MLFVVDRKDLDYQTMREYDRFEKGAANSNTSTAVLKKQLEDPTARIIITTIQKLSTFIAANKGHEIYDGHVVIIFDECHRSQFGDMHTAITKAFKRYNLFGFTGTPIFAVNAGSGGNPQLKTTEQAFGEKLHTYTIVDAITDKNVLPFRIDYVNTIKCRPASPTSRSRRSTPRRALLAPERVAKIVELHAGALRPEDQAGQAYTLGEKRRPRLQRAVRHRVDRRRPDLLQPVRRSSSRTCPRTSGSRSGSSTPTPPTKPSTTACSTKRASRPTQLDASARDFLEDAIQDYNDLFGTSFDTSADKFQNYYKDLSLRLKNREIDLVIVVNMFLTGFDATTLNTLFVDKNLRAHGLIQAYSRTNRILNSVKTYGNIVSFRDLEEETNDAIALFGNKDARGVVLLKPYGDYYAEYAEQGHRTASTGSRSGSRSSARRTQKDVHRALRRDPAAAEHPDLVRRLRRQRDPHRAPGPGLPQRLPRPLRRVPRKARMPRRSRSTTTSSSRSSSSSRSRSTSTTSSCSSRSTAQERGDGDDKELRASITRAVDASPTPAQQEGPHRSLRRLRLRHGEIDEEWQAFITAASRGRAADHHRRRTPQARRDQTLRRPRLRRRHTPDHRHSRDEDPPARLPLRPGQRPRREEGEGADAPGTSSSSASSAWGPMSAVNGDRRMLRSVRPRGARERVAHVRGCSCSAPPPADFGIGAPPD